MLNILGSLILQRAALHAGGIGRLEKSPYLAPLPDLLSLCIAHAPDVITPVSDASWGKVAAPSIGTAYYKLDYASGSVNRLTANGYAFNDGQNGEYTFSGQPNRPISFSAAFGAFTGSGISVVSTVINGFVDTPGSGMTSALGTFTLKIGGTVSVSHSAAPEPHTSTITVIVNYQ